MVRLRRLFSVGRRLLARPVVVLGWPSSPDEGKDDAENCSPTCRPTSGQSDDINVSHIFRSVKQVLRKVNQATDSNDEEQREDGEKAS
jgi:hypothetical protein